MKNYSIIKHIIVNELGLKSLEDYKAWLDTFYRKDNPEKITNEMIERLSPNNINNADFWKVVEELFGTDCVANCNYGQLPSSKSEGNKRNLMLARSTNMLSLVDMWRHYAIPVLEIGAGYGNFKSYVDMNTSMNYVGFDVLPKVDGVMATEPTGLLPKEWVEKNAGTFPLIYSSNVFQHLSAAQRSQYYKDVAKLLAKGGAFVVNLLVDLNREKDPNSETGIRYVKHYGQFTEVPQYNDLYVELTALFALENESRRLYDNFFTFTLRQKELDNSAKAS